MRYYNPAMVEHLARAAAELHQKRAGKKTTEEGLLNSPAMNTEEVFQYNKDGNKDRNNGGLQPSILFSWTADEQRKFEDAVRDVGVSDAGKIAKIMGTRSEAEVELPRYHVQVVASAELRG